MQKKSQKRKNLSDLRDLVGKLTDRDDQLKKDFRLFEDFFENFPVPVSLWSSNSEGKIISKKDKGFFCKDAKILSELVECDDLSSQLCELQEKALEGKVSRKLLRNKDKSFYVVVAPRKSNEEDVIGASGIAWDVSSNDFILNTLIEIKNSTDDKSGHLKEINKKAIEAIQKSRLNKLLKEFKDDGVS